MDAATHTATAPSPRLSRPKIRRKFWTEAELAILREHYPRGGLAAVPSLVERHGDRSVLNKAWALGVRCQPPRKPRIETDEHIDAAIRRFYAEARPKGATKRFAALIARPAWWVKKRASMLGVAVPREKEPAWSDAEIELLGECAHRVIPVIRRIFARHGYRRTETAIAVQLNRRGIARTSVDEWSAHELAGLLGVDGKTVTRWIAVEGLPATRRGTRRVESQGGDEWVIRRRALRTWIARHQQLVDLRKVERFWFLDLAFGGAA